MSFMKTLASVAVGFAAAKGIDKYRQMGGMSGLQDMMKGGADSPAADQLGQLADRMGFPGGSEAVRNFLGQMTGGAGAAAAGTAGLGGLMNAMQGAARAGGEQTAGMMDAIFSGTPAGAAMEAQAKLMLRAMIQAAKADGQIDPQEKAAILDQLGDDISAEERAFVQAELDAPVDVMGLAADAGAPMKAQIYATSLAAIRVDNANEAAYLRQLATALGLSDADRDQIHAHMGVPPLPG
ncbi:Uncharacterized membrane protein YebE, DUF533 family [Cribrihabitans marinus]|uniref:Uncharacterized membrane protein YebE, DUF533 family n=1 Tax=Cribrihabitans marinus TaxID=1227549 RepID=A0A1H6ZYT0_9RHOB|nr:DUF533 domain-containing protein [Cribrihabitans marinus]GGH29717.1 hypothetical protein GCM10010973_19360 [Cribrihabitans marinus]SEJ58633.1 Uncharacterized membrane protein YebE, DUF533 family [Cribrihabitans marinus]